MRFLKYSADQFDTSNAHALCIELEAALGLNLCVHDANAPNDVHGYLNTSAEGVEVHLYDAEDAAAIEAMPQVVRFVRCADCGRESNDWTDPDVCEDCGHDLDFAGGRAQELRAHTGIRKHTAKPDKTIVDAAERVLVTNRGMKRHPEGHMARYEHHVHDAHSRAATKLQRKADALLKRVGR